MSALTDAIDELRAIEEALQEQPALARRVHAVAATLGGEMASWIAPAEAAMLLEVYPERVIADWARIGLLRSHYLPEGDLQVRLDDVLRQKDLYAAPARDWPELATAAEQHAAGGAIDLAEMSPEERILVARARAQQREAMTAVSPRGTDSTEFR